MSHLDRRQFLALLAGAGASTLGRVRGAPAALVTATATPFFAQPDGQRCLVRFFVSGLEAPAGRLRVFDQAGRQLGTAGAVPLGDGRLYGELWLAVSTLRHLRTELAAPGLSRPQVTWHTIRPAPRWTIYWVTLLDAEAVGRYAGALERWPRAAYTAAVQQLGAVINVMPAPLPDAPGDVPFLRLAEPAQPVAANLGLPAGGFAAAAATDLELPSLTMVLAGSGVHGVLCRDAAADGVYWRVGPDGSRVLVAAPPPDADPERLEFAAGGDRMGGAVERWLEAGGWPRSEGDDRIALIVGRSPEHLIEASAAVREWNGRFVAPRIVAGDPTQLLRAIERRSADRIAVWPAPSTPLATATPTLTQVNAQAAARAAERTRRAEAMIACLVDALPSRPSSGLAAVAQQLAFPVPGTLVFNPTSYFRTDVVEMADGGQRVVTDIPPLGYRYFPLGQGDGGEWRPMPGDGPVQGVETAQFRLALDPDTGAVRSLVSRADQLEWSGEGAGLNDVPGARLETARRETLPGVGARLVLGRRHPSGGVIDTVVTAYEHLPWLDITNHAAALDGEAAAYRFDVAPLPAGLEWEIPAGVNRGVPPRGFTHLRWLRLLGKQGTVSLAALDSATAAVDPAGRLTCFGPRGDARYRLGVSPAGGFGYPDDPWRFGWGIEPLLTASVPGTGGATLPSFGSLLVIDQPGVAVAGLQPAADGDGIILYLQELSGRARVVTLGAGLIGFADARRVDLVERDLGPPAMVMRNGAGVQLAAHGVAALRLVGVTPGRA